MIPYEVTHKNWLKVILAVTFGLVIVEDTLMASILTYYLYTRRTARLESASTVIIVHKACGCSSAHIVTHLLAYVVATGALTRFFASPLLHHLVLHS